MKALYYSDSSKITQKDFVNSLAKIGIKKGDIIMVHSDISTFGRLATSDKEFLLQSLLDALKQSVGDNGTIIMPTFTYSFFKNEAFDVKNSRSTVGILTEYFRKQDGVKRTAHPTHSVAICGKNKNELMDIGKDTFDKDSIFGKIHEMNGKIVLLGVSFHKACTFIHYIEQVHTVFYRYMKKIKGKMIVNDRKYKDYFYFYNRYACFFNSFLNFEKHLLRKKLLKEVKIGNGAIYVANANEIFDEGCILLDRDPFFLLRNDFMFKFINKILYLFLKYIPWPFIMINEAASKTFRSIKLLAQQD